MSTDADRGIEGEAELHTRGVEFAARWLADRGYALESVACDIRLDPQVVATRDGRRFHIAVRTARWPDQGELECQGLAVELQDWAARHEAAAFLARVSLPCDEVDQPQPASIHFERIAPCN